MEYFENEDCLVDFLHCNTCIHKDKDESEDPCSECLDSPVNQYTTKPIKYEKDETIVEEA